MNRRDTLKAIGVFIAGLFGVKTADAKPQMKKDDYWIPLNFTDAGKGVARILYNHGPHIGEAWETMNEEFINDVPRKVLEMYPYAFHIDFYEKDKKVHHWCCHPENKVNEFTTDGKEYSVTEWKWQECRVFPDGRHGPKVYATFKEGNPVEKRVFYVDVPPGQSEKFLVALKKHFKNRAV